MFLNTLAVAIEANDVRSADSKMVLSAVVLFFEMSDTCFVESVIRITMAN